MTKWQDSRFEFLRMYVNTNVRSKQKKPTNQSTWRHCTKGQYHLCSWMYKEIASSNATITITTTSILLNIITITTIIIIIIILTIIISAAWHHHHHQQQQQQQGRRCLVSPHTRTQASFLTYHLLFPLVCFNDHPKMGPSGFHTDWSLPSLHQNRGWLRKGRLSQISKKLLSFYWEQQKFVEQRCFQVN